MEAIVLAEKASRLKLYTEHFSAAYAEQIVQELYRFEDLPAATGPAASAAPAAKPAHVALVTHTSGMEPVVSDEVLSTKEDLVRQLQAYRTKIDDLPSYNTGFKYCVDRQTKNRKANYDLADKLIKALNNAHTVTDIHTLFGSTSIKNLRVKQTCFNTVNSKDLNAVIKKGRKA